MKTKFFGLVMALCLLTGAFAGMTVLAEEGENLFKSSEWGWGISDAVTSSWDQENGVVTLNGQVSAKTGDGQICYKNAAGEIYILKAAEGDTSGVLFLHKKNTETGAFDMVDGPLMEIPEGANPYPVGGANEMRATTHNTADTETIDPNAVYRLTFSYTTENANTYFYLMHRYFGDTKAESAIGEQVVLPATDAEGETLTYYFIPGNCANGDPVTDRFMLCFGAPAGSAIKLGHGFGEEDSFVEIVKTSLKMEDLLPSEEGDTVRFITGGEQITSADARVGAKMMKVTAGDAMTMEFTPVSSLVKFRGFMKAVDMAAGDSVKVTFYQGDVEDNIKIAEKTYTYSATDENYKDIQNDVWEYFRFSGMPGGLKINAKFEVTSAAGFVYVDGVTIEEDNNLARDPRFAFALANDPNYVKWASFTGSIQTDGDCPDGQNYMVINSGNVLSSGHGSNSNLDGRIAVSANTRYLLSFWYKSEGDFRIAPYNYFSGSHNYTNPNGSAYAGFTVNEKPLPWTGFIKANSEWSRVSILLTTTSNMTYVKLAFTGCTNVEISDLSFEKIDEKEIRFFVPDLSACLQAEAMDKAQIVFMTYLGREVEVSEDVKAGESVKATCLVPVLDGDAQKLSEDKVILAAYNKAGTLVGIKVGSKAAYGASDVAGVTYGTEFLGLDGTPMNHVNYPGATLTSDAFATADSIRAFCWKSTSGLEPVLAPVTFR